MPFSLGLMCRNGTIDFTSEGWELVSPNAVALAKAMVEADPEKRPSIDDVLQNEWVVHPPVLNVRQNQRSEL